jgi:UDP-N-acetylmuramoyl-tripeptide--D-alanyl-D-alanine ligase
MFSLTLGEVAEIVGGELHGNAAIKISGVSTDSRTAKTGELFCAIVGENFDAHDCAAQAFAQGAVAVLGTREIEGDCVVIPKAVGELDAVISALGKLAAHVRDALQNISVIGVTGSSGKTSTKDMIGQVLSHHAATYAPAGSPNNELGLPMTILTAPSETKNLVLEMGMRGFGHIQYLCEIAKPTIGVVTNVGQAHIGEVGSIAGIAKAKGELVEALPESGFAILNADDVFVRKLRDATKAKVITYGFSDTSDVRGENLTITSGGTYTFEIVTASDRVTASLPMLGEHNVSNALAATAVALTVGMDLKEVAEALKVAKQPSKWRMEVHRLPENILLINDAYNANPESMSAALKTLVTIPHVGRTWAVLGAMHELGDITVEEHDRMGRLAVRLDVSQVVAVGEAARTIYLGASMEGSWDGESVWFPDFSKASDYIVNEVQPGDVLVFKASRAEKFEVLAQDVEDRLVAKWSPKGSNK